MGIFCSVEQICFKYCSVGGMYKAETVTVSCSTLPSCHQGNNAFCLCILQSCPIEKYLHRLDWLWLLTTQLSAK